MRNGPDTTNRSTERDLVLRAQQGDPDAFAALFNAHKAKVYSLCLRMTCNIAEAEDLTQDVFLHVFRKLGTFRRDSAFSTWLYRVTVNGVLMHFRRKRVAHLSLDEPVSHPAGPRVREYGKTDAALMGVVDRITVTRAMKELPAGYRSVFVLHEVKGYEHHEIARLLRCSIGTSKSQLHKAKARIRELLRLDRLQQPARTSGVAVRPAERSWLPHPDSVNNLNWEESREAA